MIYDLGIIIPVYRPRESIGILTDRIRELFSEKLTLRICIVDDSGRPETAAFLAGICRSPETAILVLDRNYGQQAATLCGLEHLDPCRYYATIDDDLEQPPEMLAALYDTIRQGYDIVYGVPAVSRRSLYRRAGSLMRDGLFSLFLGVPEGIRVSSLRIMTADLVKEACRLKPNGFFYLSASVFKGSTRPVRAVSIPYRRESNGEEDWNHVLFQKKSAEKIISGYSALSLLRLYTKLFLNYTCFPAAKRNCSRGAKPLYRISRRIRAPRLMILGGSNCQVHAFQRAKTLGIDTILADYTSSPSGARYAGLHEPVSTFDIEGCIRAAREHHADAVMTMGTDQPVYTSACVSSALNLPSLLSVGEALSVTNKKHMKTILKEAGIPAARFRFIHQGMEAGSLDGLLSPYVIKPLDSQGQRGIYRLNTPEEVFSHLEDTLSYSREQEALVEEFCESTEITVSGWLHEGRLHILTVTDRLLYPDPVHIGVCVGHRFPTAHMDRYAEIESISRSTAAAFGIANGPFYLQLLVGKDGIQVNELASRIGGAFEDVFIPFLTGFDILDAVIRSALGMPAEPPSMDCLEAAAEGRCVAVQLLFCRPGDILSITPLEELLALPYVLDAGYNYLPGQTIPAMENATARFGHAVLWGDDANISANIHDFYHRLSVRSTQGEEMITNFYGLHKGD